jgi:hypothetical protein
MSSTAMPNWILNLRDLRSSVRKLRVSRWLDSITRPTETSPSDELKQRPNRQLELLRDEITEARRAGLSWSAIGAMVGLAADTVQSIHTD